MSFDEAAEKALNDTISDAKSHYINSRCIAFHVKSSREPTVEDLRSYCRLWYPLSSVKDQSLDDRWRACMSGDCDDKTAIVLSGRYVTIQGRQEGIQALTPVGAAFALVMPPDVAMKLPSTSAFWDFLEDRSKCPDAGHPDLPSRPPSACCEVPKWLEDSSASTSQLVKDYKVPRLSKNFVKESEEAEEGTKERDPWYNPTFCNPSNPIQCKKAESALEEELCEVQRLNKSVSHTSCEFKRGKVITSGQLLKFCKDMWYDGVIDQFGTRWRPSVIEKGGIVQSEWGLSCSGTAKLCKAMMPFMAALLAGVHPNVAKYCGSMRVFWDLVGWSPNAPQPDPPKVSKKTLEKRMRWDEGFDYGGMESEDLLEVEEMAMKHALQKLHREYRRTAMWAGDSCLPGVSWSRRDFSDAMSMWCPDGECEEKNQFRFRPSFMEKGGVNLDVGGKGSSIESKELYAEGLMLMCASVILGLPAEIAALLKVSDPFWEMYEQHSRAGVGVREARQRLYQKRQERFGQAWRDERREYLVRWRAENGRSEKKMDDGAAWNHGKGGFQPSMSSSPSPKPDFWDERWEKAEWKSNEEKEWEQDWKGGEHSQPLHNQECPRPWAWQDDYSCGKNNGNPSEKGLEHSGWKSQKVTNEIAEQSTKGSSIGKGAGVVHRTEWGKGGKAESHQQQNQRGQGKGVEGFTFECKGGKGKGQDGYATWLGKGKGENEAYSPWLCRSGMDHYSRYVFGKGIGEDHSVSFTGRGRGGWEEDQGYHHSWRKGADHWGGYPRYFEGSRTAEGDYYTSYSTGEGRGDWEENWEYPSLAKGKRKGGDYASYFMGRVTDGQYVSAKGEGENHAAYIEGKGQGKPVNWGCTLPEKGNGKGSW